jgi:hypothetical protein
LVNFNLSTSDQSLQVEQNQQDTNDYYYNLENPYSKLYPDQEEMRDDRLFLFKESLNPGVYRYDYYVRVLVPGKFNHLPAVASEMYFPENFGRTGGEYFTVSE